MPTTLGKYELIKRLAVGGMAEVHLAQTAGPMGFSKTLVVKRILPGLSENEEFVSMFLNEARLAALLNHANVVQIFDLGSEGGSYYLAMELMDGPNLRELNKAALMSGERLPVGVAVKIISLACEGLAYAHEFIDPSGMPLNLVHRDISPHNILLSRSGNVKVADFGIAKAASIPSITKTGRIKGKLKYMSPEHLSNEPLDLRSDVWAMGVTLYEVLTGERPFEAPNEAGVIVRIVNTAPAPLSAHDVEGAEVLQPIVDRALAKNRDARYATARELQTDLEKVLIQRGAVVRGLEIAQTVARFVPPEPVPTPSLPRVPTAPPALPTPTSATLRDDPPDDPPEVGPVVTRTRPPDVADVGPVVTNVALPEDTPPDGVAIAPPPTPAARSPERRSEPAPVWDWIQRHPIASGLLVGVVVVVALFAALAAQSRELAQKAAEQAELTAPLRRPPLAVDAQSAHVEETPVMDFASRPVVPTVSDERAERRAIDEPGADTIVKATAAQAVAAGKAAPPIPKRHIGPTVIDYGFLELNVLPACYVAIDRTSYGTTPLSVPLEPGSHDVLVECRQPPHHERFQIQVAPGVHLLSKVNLRQSGSVAGALVSQRLDSVHRTSGRRSPEEP